MSLAEHPLEERPSTRHVRPKKVLIVDRDEFWGPAVRLALEQTGYYLNLVREPAEGRRRAYERVYDLVVLSTSAGEAALRAILRELERQPSPPPVLIVAGADELKNREELGVVPCLSILRRPCAVEDVVDAARALVGAPWSDDRAGA